MYNLTVVCPEFPHPSSASVSCCLLEIIHNFCNQSSLGHLRVSCVWCSYSDTANIFVPTCVHVLEGIGSDSWKQNFWVNVNERMLLNTG